MGNKITSRKEDYSKWYNDIVINADLAENSEVRGCMVIKPYGFSIWELMKKELDQMFKDTGHQNAYFPLFVPKSLFEAEEKNAEGFAKECAIVTHYRLKNDPKKKGKLILDPESKLEEELIVRPTSEAVIWKTYKKWIQSYRDLPLLINQWANVVRWEMRTRLFLRTTEFLWQEGHTAHATAEEAQKETLLILELYRRLAEDYLAMPVYTGLKSESEKFAGADLTYCIEAMMGDKRALQAGTSHNLGQNFAKAFDVTFQNKDNIEEMVYATSWGISTRLVGGVIMTHGDDKGLQLPPKIAPHQVVVIPIYRDDKDQESVKNYLNNIIPKLKAKGIRVHEDWRKGSPGFKFNEWEMKGAPLRLEVGPKDIENDSIILARRDNSEKQTVQKDSIVETVSSLLDDIQTNLFDKAKNFRDSNTHTVSNYDEFKEVINSKGGFIKCGWDGTSKTENKIKNDTKATIRVIPTNESPKGLKCVYSGKDAKHEVIFAKAY